MPLRFKKFLVIFVGVSLLVGGVTTSLVRAENLTAVEAQAAVVSSSALDMIECGGVFSGLKLSCIVPTVLYYGIYMPAMGLLTLSGYIFDFMIALSIDRDFIKQPFVEAAWTIVRDFSNMIFIFILLYTGIQTMLFGAKWQETVSKVVIVALIINFSMFFTNVVIDAGNILAMGVYSGMGVEKTAAVDKTHKTGGVPERNLSATLVNAFAPQQFMTLAGENDRSFAATIFIIAAIVSAYVAYVFFKVSFLFMGRIIAFWFYIIISPYALVSMTLPKGNIYGTWTQGLLNQAFVAPIFLFLVYLIMKAVEGGTTAGPGIFKGFGTPQSGNFFFDMVFVPIVITVMILYALDYALGVAKSQAGKFGDIGMKALNTVVSAAPMGMAANVALGGGAAALRATAGQGAGKLLESGALRRLGTSENKFLKYTGISAVAGRGGMKLAEKVATGSLDIRQTGALQKGAKTLGVDLNLGKAEGKGGWAAEQKKRKKDDKAQAEKYEVTDVEKSVKAVQVNPEYKDAKARAEREYQEERAKILVHTEAKASEAAARARAESTTEGKLLVGAHDKVTQTKSATKMEGDKLSKKIEDLKKKQKDVVGEELKKLQEETAKIEDLQKQKEKEWQDVVARAEQEQATLTRAVEQAMDPEAFQEMNQEIESFVDASNKLREADAAAQVASGTLSRTQKIVKGTEEELSNWVQSENERRREQISYVQTATRFFYTHGDREAAVKNIRDEKKKKSAKERKEDREKDDVLKNITKLMSKKKEEEGVGEEEKPKEEGGEKK